MQIYFGQSVIEKLDGQKVHESLRNVVFQFTFVKCFIIMIWSWKNVSIAGLHYMQISKKRNWVGLSLVLLKLVLFVLPTLLHKSLEFFFRHFTVAIAVIFIKYSVNLKKSISFWGSVIKRSLKYCHINTNIWRKLPNIHFCHLFR